jgi:hypothetical protein
LSYTRARPINYHGAEATSTADAPVWPPRAAGPGPVNRESHRRNKGNGTAGARMRLCKFITLACGMATVWPLSAAAVDVTGVTVLNAQLQSIRTIASVSDLAVFSRLWATRVKVNASTSVRPGYSIVIQHGDRRSERWLYDDAGIVQVLSIWKTPVYRLPSPTEFNQLLGIGAP